MISEPVFSSPVRFRLAIAKTRAAEHAAAASELRQAVLEVLAAVGGGSVVVAGAHSGESAEGSEARRALTLMFYVSSRSASIQRTKGSVPGDSGSR